MAGRRVPVRALLEASYRFEQSPSDWLSGVIAAATPALDAGLGVCGYFVDLRNGGFSTSEYQGTEAIGSAAGRAAFAAWNTIVPLEARRYSTLNIVSGEMSTLVQRMRACSDAPADLALLEASHGFPDLRGVNAVDAELLGCSLAAPLSSRAPRRGDERMWSRVASHLCAGARLLRRLGIAQTSLIDAAEAVITPSGQIVHAQGEARDRIARAALRDAALRIDYARSRNARLSDDEFTLAWRALHQGRWTLLDSFDHDGRRYFVAWPNEPEIEQPHALSVREEQVVRGAALGHSNKLIAYELGLTTSSVATLLARAARKLRVRSRAALIRRIANDLGLPAALASVQRSARKQ